MVMTFLLRLHGFIADAVDNSVLEISRYIIKESIYVRYVDIENVNKCSIINNQQFCKTSSNYFKFEGSNVYREFKGKLFFLDSEDTSYSEIIRKNIQFEFSPLITKLCNSYQNDLLSKCLNSLSKVPTKIKTDFIKIFGDCKTDEVILKFNAYWKLYTFRKIPYAVYKHLYEFICNALVLFASLGLDMDKQIYTNLFNDFVTPYQGYSIDDDDILGVNLGLKLTYTDIKTTVQTQLSFLLKRQNCFLLNSIPSI